MPPIAPEDDHSANVSANAGAAAADEADLVMPELELTVDVAEDAVSVKKNHNASPDLMVDISEEDVERIGVLVPVLSDTASAVDDWITKGRIGEVDVSDDSLGWYKSMVDGFKSLPSNGVFEDALADPNADWRDALEFGSTKINIGRPRFSNAGRDATRMSSERLQLSVRARLGLGAPTQVPLMASGFYMTVKPAGEDEIIALWREIISQTVRLGRTTHGLMFSNNQVFAARAVVQAWMRLMVDSTVSDLPRESLIDHITINDLPIIYASMASSIYPNGFPMTRSVFTEDTHLPAKEISQMINVRKALFMNANSFTEAQRQHMAKRFGSQMTLKGLKEYREAFTIDHTAAVEIGHGIRLHLKTPTLREYFESGEKWINDVTITMREALGETPDEGTRATYMSRLAKASRLRQYAHYVTAIEEEGEMYSTRENVDRVLKDLSASDEVAKTFYKGVSDFINRTQVAIVATTSVNAYEDKMTGEKWPRLIALDALSVFFQLVEQKLDGIMSRALEDT